MSYKELSLEERISIQLGQLQGLSQRAIAQMLDRNPSTISRELCRNGVAALSYSASQAHQKMRQRRTVCRPARKLEPVTELFDLVVYLLRQRFSPQQIAGKLRRMEFSKLEDVYVCRETIYNAIYAWPVGELRK
jgi:IS30 family transposase